jgi:hypothetical protein
MDNTIVKTIKLNTWTDHFGDKWLLQKDTNWLFSKSGVPIGFRLGKMALIYPDMKKYI